MVQASLYIIFADKVGINIYYKKMELQENYSHKNFVGLICHKTRIKEYISKRVSHTGRSKGKLGWAVPNQLPIFSKAMFESNDPAFSANAQSMT